MWIFHPCQSVKLNFQFRKCIKYKVLPWKLCLYFLFTIMHAKVISNKYLHENIGIPKICLFMAEISLSFFGCINADFIICWYSFRTFFERILYIASELLLKKILYFVKFQERSFDYSHIESMEGRQNWKIKGFDRNNIVIKIERFLTM